MVDSYKVLKKLALFPRSWSEQEWPRSGLSCEFAENMNLRQFGTEFLKKKLSREILILLRLSFEKTAKEEPVLHGRLAADDKCCDICFVGTPNPTG